MKKHFAKTAIAIALASTMTLSSCLGSFSLTNKLVGWNQHVGNKFVNELVFFAFWILPVYEVSVLADVIVLNSIEFWSGTNPVAENTKIIEGQDQRYIVKTDKTGYTITGESDRQVTYLSFDNNDKSWSVAINNKENATKFMTFIDDSHVNMITPDGTMMPVELSQRGVLAYSEVAQSANLTFNK